MKESNSAQSLAKFFPLLDYMADCKQPMRLQQIANDIGIPQATVLRYLNSMIRFGYVYQDADTEKYSLTRRICGVGERALSHLGIRGLSGNLVADLSIKLELGVALVIENNKECMYLDCVYDERTIGQTLQRIGGLTPMHATSSGKILLSRLSEYEIKRIISEKGLVALTEHTITSEQALMEELIRTKERGYAIDNEECEAGLRCISVPIYDYTETIVAAVCCFGSVGQMQDEDIEKKILPQLRQTANEISLRMGSATAI